MSPKQYSKKIEALKVVDALNKIEGVPVTDYSHELSDKWAKDEITGSKFKVALIAKQKKV